MDILLLNGPDGRSTSVSVNKSLTPDAGQKTHSSKVAVPKLTNVWSSVAGVGSDFFYIYRRSRDAERARVEKIDADWNEDIEHKIHQAERAKKMQMSEILVQKRAKKNAKKKQRKKDLKMKQKLKKRANGKRPSGVDGDEAEFADESSDGCESSDEGAPEGDDGENQNASPSAGNPSPISTGSRRSRKSSKMKPSPQLEVDKERKPGSPEFRRKTPEEVDQMFKEQLRQMNSTTNLVLKDEYDF